MSHSLSDTQFRDALACFASGVVVVTAHAKPGPVGFTASAFTSVSVEPPLVLVCVGRQASAFEGIARAPLFGVSVLKEQQEWIARQFAGSKNKRFAGVALRAVAPVPLIEGSLAQLVCRPHALHDAGDHTIVVGEVVGASTGPGRPLVHWGRTFGAFAGVQGNRVRGAAAKTAQEEPS